MRHGKKVNHLSRTASHRKAMLANMASSLLIHKRITTTVAKAKALRKYVEPLITKSKTDTTHSRRTVFSYLQDKEAIIMLFDEVSDKVADRPGGYTRIIRTGYRLGDNAETCMIELVDYNELLLKETDDSKSKTRRSRRRGKKSSGDSTESKPKVEATKVEESVAEDIEPISEEIKSEEDTTTEEGEDKKNKNDE
jgi:large subunit ribosomal protein L17